MGTIEHTGWYDPLIDSERAERLRAWQDGLDAAISAIRQAEGFDGDERPWQTLGEYLRLPTRHPVPFRPTVARTPIQTRAYSRMSPATRRRQALAAEDVGRLVDAS